MTKPKPARPLSDREHALLTYIRAFRSAHDYAPGMRQMALQLGTSTSMINYHIKRLETRGLLHVPRDEYGAMLAHTVNLTNKAHALLNVHAQMEVSHAENQTAQ